MALFPLNVTLGDLEGIWLEVACCRGVTYLPMRQLAGARRRRMRLCDAIPRLRCKACGGPPHGLALVENPAGRSDFGPPPGWVIPLA